MLQSKSFMGSMTTFMLALMLVLGACSNYNANTYTGSEARTMQTIKYGTVLAVRPVTIQEEGGGTVGTVGGAAIGGVVGNMFGHGDGKTLATIAGALVGAGAGHATGKAIASQDALEISVRLDDGQEIAIVQGNDQTFAIGSRVRILTSSNGSVRITY